MARFLRMAAAYKRRLKFQGQLLLEPKPQVRESSDLASWVQLPQVCKALHHVLWQLLLETKQQASACQPG